MAETKNILNLSTITGKEYKSFRKGIFQYQDNILKNNSNLNDQPERQFKPLEIKENGNILNIKFPEPISLPIKVEDGKVTILDENISEDQMKELLTFFYNQPSITAVTINDEASEDFKNKFSEQVATHSNEQDEKRLEGAPFDERTPEERGLEEATEKDIEKEEDKAFNPLQYWKDFNKPGGRGKQGFVKQYRGWGGYPHTIQFFADEDAYNDHGKSEGKGKYKNNVLCELTQTGLNSFTMASPKGGKAEIPLDYWNHAVKFMKKQGAKSIYFGPNLTDKDVASLLEACGKSGVVPVGPNMDIKIDDYEKILLAYKSNKDNEMRAYNLDGERIKPSYVDFAANLANEVIRQKGGIKNVTPASFREQINEALNRLSTVKYNNPNAPKSHIEADNINPNMTKEARDDVLKAMATSGAIPTGIELTMEEVEAMIKNYKSQGTSKIKKCEYVIKLAYAVRNAYAKKNLEPEKLKELNKMLSNDNILELRNQIEKEGNEVAVLADNAHKDLNQLLAKLVTDAKIDLAKELKEKEVIFDSFVKASEKGELLVKCTEENLKPINSKPIDDNFNTLYNKYSENKANKSVEGFAESKMGEFAYQVLSEKSGEEISKDTPIEKIDEIINEFYSSEEDKGVKRQLAKAVTRARIFETGIENVTSEIKDIQFSTLLSGGDRKDLAVSSASYNLVPKDVTLKTEDFNAAIDEFEKNPNNSKSKKREYTNRLIKNVKEEMKRKGVDDNDDDSLMKSVNTKLMQEFVHVYLKKYREEVLDGSGYNHYVVMQQTADFYNKISKLKSSNEVEKLLSDPEKTINDIKKEFEQDKNKSFEKILLHSVCKGNRDKLKALKEEAAYSSDGDEYLIGAVDSHYKNLVQDAKQNANDNHFDGALKVTDNFILYRTNVDSEKTKKDGNLLYNKFYSTPKQRYNALFETGVSEYFDENGNNSKARKLAVMEAINLYSEEYSKNVDFKGSINSLIDDYVNNNEVRLAQFNEKELINKFNEQTIEFENSYNENVGEIFNRNKIKLSKEKFKYGEAVKHTKIIELDDNNTQETSQLQYDQQQISLREKRTAMTNLAVRMQALEKREDLDELSKACLKMAAMDLHDDINEGLVADDKVVNNLSYYAKSYKGAVLQKGIDEKDWINYVNKEVDLFNKESKFTLEEIKERKEEEVYKKEKLEDQPEEEKAVITEDNYQQISSVNKRARERNVNMRDKVTNIRRSLDSSGNLVHQKRTKGKEM